MFHNNDQHSIVTAIPYKGGLLLVLLLYSLLTTATLVSSSMFSADSLSSSSSRDSNKDEEKIVQWRRRNNDQNDNKSLNVGLVQIDSKQITLQQNSEEDTTTALKKNERNLRAPSYSLLYDDDDVVADFHYNYNDDGTGITNSNDIIDSIPTMFADNQDITTEEEIQYDEYNEEETEEENEQTLQVEQFEERRFVRGARRRLQSSSSSSSSSTWNDTDTTDVTAPDNAPNVDGSSTTTTSNTVNEPMVETSDKPTPAPIWVERIPSTSVGAYAPVLSNDDPQPAAPTGWKAPTAWIAPTTSDGGSDTSDGNKPVWKPPSSSSSTSSSTSPTIAFAPTTGDVPTFTGPLPTVPYPTVPTPTVPTPTVPTPDAISNDTTNNSTTLSNGTATSVEPTTAEPTTAKPSASAPPTTSMPSTTSPTLLPQPTLAPTKRPRTEEPTTWIPTILRATQIPTDIIDNSNIDATKPPDDDVGTLSPEGDTDTAKDPSVTIDGDDINGNSTTKASISFDTVVLNLFLDAPAAIQLNLDALGKATAYHIMRQIKIIEIPDSNEIVLIQNVEDLQITPVGTDTRWVSKNNTVLQTYEIKGRAEYNNSSSTTAKGRNNGKDTEGSIAKSVHDMYLTDSVDKMIHSAFSSDEGRKKFVAYMEISSDSSLRRIYDVYAGSTSNLIQSNDDNEDGTTTTGGSPATAPATGNGNDDSPTKLVDISDKNSPISIALITSSTIAACGVLIVLGMYLWKKRLDSDIISIDEDGKKSKKMLRNWDNDKEKSVGRNGDGGAGDVTLRTFSDGTGKFDNSTIGTYSGKLSIKRILTETSMAGKNKPGGSSTDSRVKGIMANPSLFNQGIHFMGASSLLGSLYNNRDTMDDPDSESNIDTDEDEDSKAVALRKVHINNGSINDSSDISSVYSYIETNDLVDMIQDEAYSVGNGGGGYGGNGFFDGDDDDEDTRHGTWSVRADDHIHLAASNSSIAPSTTRTAATAGVVTGTVDKYVKAETAPVRESRPTEINHDTTEEGVVVGGFVARGKEQLQRAIKQLTAASGANGNSTKQAEKTLVNDPEAGISSSSNKNIIPAIDIAKPKSLIDFDDEATISTSTTDVFLSSSSASALSPSKNDMDTKKQVSSSSTNDAQSQLICSSRMISSTSTTNPAADHDTESSTSGSSDGGEHPNEDDHHPVLASNEMENVNTILQGSADDHLFDGVLVSSDSDNDDDADAANNNNDDDEDGEDDEEPEVIRATVAERRIASAALAYGNVFKAKQMQRIMPKKRTDTNDYGAQPPESQLTTTQLNLYSSSARRGARTLDGSNAHNNNTSTTSPFGVARIGGTVVESDASDSDIHSVDGDQSMYSSASKLNTTSTSSGYNSDNDSQRRRWSLGSNSNHMHHKYDDLNNNNTNTNLVLPAAYNTSSSMLHMIDMSRNKYNLDTDDDLSSTAGSEHNRYDPNINLNSLSNTTKKKKGNRTMFNDLASF